MPLVSESALRLFEEEKAGILMEARQAIWARRPDLLRRYDDRQKMNSDRDLGYHLAYLAEAVKNDSPELFLDYAAWLKVFLPRVGVPVEDIRLSLECLAEALSKRLEQEDRHVFQETFLRAGKRLEEAGADLESFIRGEAVVSVLAAQYLGTMLRADRRQAGRLILEAADRGIDIRELYLGVFQPVQYEIGRLWQTNAISVAQEHMATAITQTVMGQLAPRLFAGEKNGKTMVAACVSGELHEIGMRMVADFFEMSGWDTYYIGANAPASSIARAVEENKADLLGISATMAFHLPAVEEIIREVRKGGMGKNVKILVGGYPFKVAPDLWRKVGADGFASDAKEAVRIS